MDKYSKIYIVGHTGLVGSALERKLISKGYTNILTKNHEQLDLRDQKLTKEFFEEQKPEYVFFAAGKVGGINANINYPAEFITDNIQMQTNVIDAAWKNKVKKLIYFGSCCAYPTGIERDIREEDLFTGILEPTNQAFAVAKLAGIEMCKSYDKQYGTNFISIIPANLYGPRDNFHPKDSHVVGMAIRLLHEAKENKQLSVTFGGTGDAVRDWLYVDDLADACLFLMENYNFSEPINIGTGEGTSKKQIIYTLKDIIEFKGEIFFDSTKPDGMKRRVLDVKKINSLGWKAKTILEDGLKKTYEWYLENII